MENLDYALYEQTYCYMDISEFCHFCDASHTIYIHVTQWARTVVCRTKRVTGQEWNTLITQHE